MEMQVFTKPIDSDEVNNLEERYLSTVDMDVEPGRMLAVEVNLSLELRTATEGDEGQEEIKFRFRILNELKLF